MFFSFQQGVNFEGYEHNCHKEKVPPQVVPRCDSTFLDPCEQGFEE